MENNYKNLKLYKWLTHISPLLFELKMKLECDYNFFNRAKHSLNFPFDYLLEIESAILIIHRYTQAGLDLYANLPSNCLLDVFCQIMLKIAIYHWKLLPVMLAELFKVYPQIGPELIEFSDLELDLFDAWLKLPKCIDELYIIMLEKGWYYTMQQGDKYWAWDPYGSFDVADPNTFNQLFKSYLENLQKKEFLLDNSNIVELYEIKLRNIPYILDLMSYLVQNKKKPTLSFADFAKSMTHISLFTNQLLLVNSFFDFCPKREYHKKRNLEISPEEMERMKKYCTSLNIKKKERLYKNYEEYYAACTYNLGQFLSYPGEFSNTGTDEFEIID